MVRRPFTLSSLISLDIGGGLLALTLALGILVYQGIRGMLDDALDDKATALARQLATVSLDAALIYDYGTLERYVRDLVDQRGVLYLQVRRQDGEVLGEAGTEPDPAMSATTLTVVQPLLQGHNRFGEVTVSYDRSPVVRTMNRISVLGLGGVIFLTIVLYFVQRRILERRLVRPLQAIAEQASPLRRTRPLSQDGLPQELVRISQMLERMCNELVEHSEHREQAHRVAREVNERLCKDQRLVIVGQLAAGLAHGLNTPLGNILGYAQQAQRADLDEATRSRLVVIEQQARTCSEIVRNLLTSARPPEMVPQPLDLDGHVRRILELMRPVLRDSGIQHIEFGDQAHALAVAVPGGIDQVLYNLLSNAAEARASRVEIRTLNRNGQVILDVRDNGSGIPATVQERVFEPFVTSKAPDKGTGLGLYLCRSLLQAMGGDIHLIETHPGATVFHITLQAVTRDSGPTESSP